MVKTLSNEEMVKAVYPDAKAVEFITTERWCVFVHPVGYWGKTENEAWANAAKKLNDGKE